MVYSPILETSIEVGSDFGLGTSPPVTDSHNTEGRRSLTFRHDLGFLLSIPNKIALHSKADTIFCSFDLDLDPIFRR